MSSLELESLLKEISPNHPSGELDLEHDPDFMELEKEIQGTPEVEVGGRVVQEARDPDWDKCAETAVELLGRAHDMRVAVSLTRALLHTKGIKGLHDGLKLIRVYVEDYWDTIYPQLDPDDDDPFERVNVLETLSDWGLVVGPLMKVELCSSRTAGSVSLRQYRIATGNTSGLSLTSEEIDSAPNLASIDGAFAESSPELLQSISINTRGAFDEAKRLESLMNEKVGADRSPDLKKLIQILGEIDNFVQEHLLRNAASGASTVKEPKEESVSAEKNAPTTSKRVRSFDMIEKREDVLELLEQVCAYYELFEPASPVPLLLRRAMRLVTMNFMEIIEDLAPDSLSTVAMLCGPKEP